MPDGTKRPTPVTPPCVPLLGTFSLTKSSRKAWLDLDVPQCGYCQSGMIMAAASLLKQKPKPTDADIDAAMTNICRCGTYQRVRAAIHAAAGNA